MLLSVNNFRIKCIFSGVLLGALLGAHESFFYCLFLSIRQKISIPNNKFERYQIINLMRKDNIPPTSNFGFLCYITISKVIFDVLRLDGRTFISRIIVLTDPLSYLKFKGYVGTFMFQESATISSMFRDGS